MSAMMSISTILKVRIEPPSKKNCKINKIEAWTAPQLDKRILSLASSLVHIPTIRYIHMYVVKRKNKGMK